MFDRKIITVLIIVVLFLFSFYLGMYLTSMGLINSKVYSLLFAG